MENRLIHFQISHVRWEANQQADFLATKALQYDIHGLILIVLISSSLIYCGLMEDIYGIQGKVNSLRNIVFVHYTVMALSVFSL